MAPYEVGEGGEEPKALLTVSFLLPEGSAPESTELVVGLSVLDHILSGTPASPLRKALIDSGLGEDLGVSSAAASQMLDRLVHQQLILPK